MGTIPLHGEINARVVPLWVVSVIELVLKKSGASQIVKIWGIENV
jgi:hypothetical protein